MAKLSKLPLTLAAGAMALAGFAAGPAQADDGAIIGLLAGAAAVAIIANAANADQHRLVTRHDYRPAPPHRSRWQRARWERRWHQDHGPRMRWEHY
jgi:hypothetical protein